MRTTVSIDDHLLVAAKRRAQHLGLTLGRFIEEALRRELARNDPSVPPIEIPVFRGGNGVRPGIDLASNRAVLEALDEGQPLDRLR